MERFFITQKNNNRVVVGGVRLLAEFDVERVVVKVHGGVITVTGTGLKIARFDENEIEITGKIINVESMCGGGV